MRERLRNLLRPRPVAERYQAAVEDVFFPHALPEASALIAEWENPATSAERREEIATACNELLERELDKHDW